MSHPSRSLTGHAQPEGPGGRWHVVIPVKDTRTGKSRLARSVGGDRAELSRAIAIDTVVAVATALGPARVTVVTSDAGLTGSFSALGIDVLPDPDRGLTGAIEAGLARVAPHDRPAALLGDLPALRPVDLLTALEAASRHPQSFVPDAEGVGTVLRCGSTASGFTPRFGADSAARHAADGAVRLELDLPHLRTDVDDAASLALAGRLGLGEQTRHVVASRTSGWIHPMQASVHTFDPDTHEGSVLRDDGLELPFGAAAFEASGLRLLRLGQRLTVDVVDDAVIALRIVGIGADQPIR